jgi:hypothetical protein
LGFPVKVPGSVLFPVHGYGVLPEDLLPGRGEGSYHDLAEVFSIDIGSTGTTRGTSHHTEGEDKAEGKKEGGWPCDSHLPTPLRRDGVCAVRKSRE